MKVRPTGQVDLEVTVRSRDLRSTIDLDLDLRSYTFFDAYRREDLDGIVIFALARLVVISKKLPGHVPLF